MISRAQCRIGIEAAVKTNMKFQRVPGVSLVIAALVLCAASATPAQESAATSTLIVNVTGLRNAKGKVDALLFVHPEGFPEDDKKAFDKDEVPIDPKTMSAQIVFTDVPRGFAAVTVLHDENMNRKMDKNFLGIPKEGYGTSNNPKKAAHDPKWIEGRFPVNLPKETIQIKLIYW
jgi:uncharacterized protein (DUF2141 family)